jgi:hypothetical protein
MKPTTVAKNEHLQWHWMSDFIGFWPLYFFFFSVFLVEKMYYVFLLALATFAISVFSQLKEHTFGSVWCWSANILSLYLVLKILFYDNVLCG